MNYKNEIGMYRGKWRAFAFNSEAASTLNRRLRAYNLPEWDGSEGVFTFEAADLPFVRAVLTKLGGLQEGAA